MIIANLYGTPSKLDQISEICERHHVVLIEDAAESLGATYKNVQTGTFGHYNVISLNKTLDRKSGSAIRLSQHPVAECY